jgi:hypothetical protein
MSYQKNFKDFIIHLEPFSIHIGVSTTAFLGWAMFVFLPLWPFYFIPGMIGGFLAGIKYYRGFIAGFLGMIIAQVIFLNFALFSAAESVELVIEAALNVSGLGIIIHLIILLMWSFFSGFGGFIGTSLYSFIPFYE